MSQLLAPLLTLVLVYGYPIVAVLILASYLAIPIPLGAILLAAGSFTADGTLNFYALIVVITITAVAGDIVGYFLAKKYGLRVLQKTLLRSDRGKNHMAALHQFVKRWGWWSIFSTRWLFTPLGLPIDLLAGVTHYPVKKFLLAVSTGELLWAVIYVWLGYEFGSNWSTLVDYINNVPEVLALVVVGILFVSVGLRIRRNHK